METVKQTPTILNGGLTDEQAAALLSSLMAGAIAEPESCRDDRRTFLR